MAKIGNRRRNVPIGTMFNGNKFLGYFDRFGDGHSKPKFECKCGKEFWASIRSVEIGKQKGCGCSKGHNLQCGDIFNGFEFLEYTTGLHKLRMGKFKCHCGKIVEIRCARVWNGRFKGCGCHLEKMKAGRWEERIHLKPENKLTYESYKAMIRRCINPNAANYRLYGQRGILIDPYWLTSFENFLKDMGSRPSKAYTLDRFPNVDGNYEKSNCRWGTAKQQGNNKRDNLRLTIDGVTKTCTEWSEISGVDRSTISGRIKRGWEHKDAVWMLPLPKNKMFKKYKRKNKNE